MNKINAFLGLLVACGLFWIGFALQSQGRINAKMVEIEEKKLAIEQEKHIDYLYTVYQDNMSGCKKNASDQGKDEKYIKEKCVDVINNSIIANWLKDRGYSDLIK